MTDSALSAASSNLSRSYDVLIHSWVSADHEQLANLRRCPGPGPGLKLATTFLKNADEQAVVGLAAICNAIHSLGEQTGAAGDWTDWGIVVAPRYFGRQVMAGTVQRYLAEGAWGMSPNLIPHRSLHSASGTMSQALKTHGPNFGVGGVAEAIRCAAGLLDSAQTPGVWVVLPSWDPEPELDENSAVPPETKCVALALALTLPRHDRPRLRLTVAAGGATGVGPRQAPREPAALHALLEQARQGERSPTTLVCPLDAHARLEITCHSFARNYLPAGVPARAAFGPAAKVGEASP